jgi:hypothetical protein
MLEYDPGILSILNIGISLLGVLGTVAGLTKI